MKIFIPFCYIIIIFIIFTTSTNAYPKSFNDNQFNLRDNEANPYPVKRKAPNPQPPTFVAREEQPEFDSAIKEPSARYRRIDNNYDRKVSVEKELDLKRTSLMNRMGKRADRLYKRDLRPSRREEAYGIVYGNGRPIGILEPFPQAYELSPMYNSREGIEEIEPVPQVNPRSAMDMFYTDRLAGGNSRNDWEDTANIQDPGKFNEKYPAPLNDYKITNRMNNNGMAYKHDGDKIANNQVTSKRDTMVLGENQKKDPEFVGDNLDEPNKATEVKRSTITNEKIDKLKFALNRMQNPGPSDRVEEIEDNLRDILSDMGLIEGEDNGMDSYKNKRENDAKRDIVDKEDENLEEGVNKIELVKATHEAPVMERSKREEKKEENLDKAKGENIPETSLVNNKPELDELKEEPKEEIKRSEPKIANYQTEGDAYIRNKRQESNDIMKGLEKSGDLTVSGNKSPLASSENDAEMEKRRNKDQTTAGSISEKTKREHDEYQYQKEIEENIQAKIDAIKEQVKREIEALKTKASQENLRQKRDVNTLLAEETSALDPQKHPDEKLIPHIRRRRNLEESLTREKRGLPDFSNLKNIDSGDYLDLSGEKSRNQRETVQDYEADPQENKYLPEEGLEKKRSSDQEGLPAAEPDHLNVNNQDDTNLNDNTNIRERSIDNPSPITQEKKSVSPETSPKDINQQQPEEERIKNEEQPEVILSETKSHDDALVDKRSPDSEIIPELKKNKEEDKKREVEESNIPKKRDVTISGKSEETISSKATEEPILIEKKEPKRNIEESSLNSKGMLLQPEEEESQKTVKSRRRRRQIDQEVIQNPNMVYRRRKRANAIIPYAKSSFFPYRAEEEDGEDDGDEFDEDSFEDRSNLQKRETGYNIRQSRRSLDYQPDYASSDDYPNSYQPEQKRSLASRYVANENSDVYENPSNYLYHPVSYVRQKRQNFDQLASLHGGGPMLHHLAAVRERSMQQFEEDNNRNKRNFNKIEHNPDNQNVKEEPENIADLSASDLFGALPQSYDGSNLQRFKRIKRNVNSSEKIQNTTEISVKV